MEYAEGMAGCQCSLMAVTSARHVEVVDTKQTHRRMSTMTEQCKDTGGRIEALYALPFMDRDGYPTEVYLQWLEHIKDVVDLDEFEELAQTIVENWWMDDWGAHYKRAYDGYRTLHLSTGGWSGNEDIIHALKQTWLWRFCWMQSKRGGHYKLRIPVSKKDE